MEVVHKKKTLIGKIIKVSSKETVKVEVESKFPHPKYGKIVMRHRGYLVHDDARVGQIEVGDIVKIEESRPISKLKKWIVVEKITKNN